MRVDEVRTPVYRYGPPWWASVCGVGLVAGALVVSSSAAEEEARHEGSRPAGAPAPVPAAVELTPDEGREQT
jgi:hypothetical protein